MPSKLETMWISRQDTIPVANSPLQPNYISTHVHPFQTLPQLDSHLLPHFVIFETGRKLQTLSPIDVPDFMSQNPLLLKILRIYQAWTKRRPEGAEQDDTFIPPSPPSDEDSETESDTKTQPRRARKKSRRSPQSSPTPHAKGRKLGKRAREGKDISDDAGKRKRAYHSALSLSGKTLRNYFEGEKMWTADSIRAWSDNNCPLADDAQFTTK